MEEGILLVKLLLLYLIRYMPMLYVSVVYIKNFAYPIRVLLFIYGVDGTKMAVVGMPIDERRMANDAIALVDVEPNHVTFIGFQSLGKKVLALSSIRIDCHLFIRLNAHAKINMGEQSLEYSLRIQSSQMMKWHSPSHRKYWEALHFLHTDH
ncbi:hypothetical protein ACJX0J_007504 [Zea mays]